MDINISISPATSIIANYLVVVIYEETSPNVVADFQTFAAPHVASRNISFVNCNPVPHFVKIFENAAAAVGGTIRHQFLYNPNFKNAEIRDDLFIAADVTPGFPSSGISYTDATLEGWKWSLERRGFGTMQIGIDYSWDSNTNTWELLATVDTPEPEIEPGEIFVLHFQPKITTSVVPATTSSIVLFSAVEILDDDTDLDQTIIGKAIQLAGVGPQFSVVLPDLTTILANRPLIIMSNGGNHVNASIKAYAGQTIEWLNEILNEVNIGQSEQIWMYKWVDPGNTGIYCWKVLHSDGNFRTAGEFVNSYKDSNVLNCLYANGALVSRTTYRRLWNYVQSLDPSMLVSEADWNNAALNNKAKYSTGDGATTFRIPLSYATGFYRAVNSNIRKAGSHEGAQLLDHRHEGTIGTLPVTLFGRGLINRLLGKYNGTGNGLTDLTGSPLKTDGTAISTGNGNWPDNTAEYRLIRI